MVPDEVRMLYRRHGREIRLYLARRLNCAETAADLAQETFVRLMRSRVSAPIQDPRAYLYRIAANLVTDHVRGERQGPSLQPDTHLAWLPDAGPGPERTLLGRDAVRRLERAVDDLPPRRREIFRLHKFEGLSYGEIADRLGIAKNTVMVQMMKALAHCRDRLAE